MALQIINTVRTFGRRWIYSSSAVLKQYNVIDPPDDPEIIVPIYKPKDGESMEVRKARLVYQSRKRAMLENGLLLSTFASKYLNKLSDEQIVLYDRLINEPSNDWDIYYWATCKVPTPSEYDNEIMDMLKLHATNVNKEKRYIQPDLYS